MSSSLGLPVIAGFASGIALIVIFSFFTLSSDHAGNEILVVLIPEGSSLESNPPFLVPDVIKVKIGVNNTVRWINQDKVPHSVISDTGYSDPVTGASFGTLESNGQLAGGFMREGASYEFTFRETGEFGYHGEPHPWMQGTVIVLAP